MFWRGSSPTRPFPDAASNNEPWDTAFDVFGMYSPQRLAIANGIVPSEQGKGSILE
jgi:hypothetical protein